MEGWIPDKEAALMVLHDLLGLAPYVPRPPSERLRTWRDRVRPLVPDQTAEAKQKGSYALPERTVRIVAHGCPPPDAVHFDGTRLESRGQPPGYGFSDGRIEMRFTDRGEAHLLEIDPAP